MIKSNKMEALMDAMVAVLKEVPGDPMTPEWIGIQSRGMKQWISTQIAQKLGICANLSFLFPRQILEQVFSSFETEKSLLLTEDILMWSIMDNILKNQSGLNSTGLNNSGFTSKSKSCFSDLERYIQDDASGRKLFQLSMKIARVFDDYQIYRPNMLLDWNKADGKESFKDPVMAWQSVIWRQVSQSHTNMATRMDEFLKQAALDRAGKGKPGYLPGRICLFGVSAMPARFLDVFAALAYTMDIYLFLLTPSNQFFFDIKSQRQMEKIVLDSSAGINSDQAYYEIANPLLASLGLSGRDFHGTLEEFDYHEPFEDLFQDPMLQDPMPQDLINQDTIDQDTINQNTIDLSQSMLSVLQSDILNLVYRSPGTDHPPLAVSKKDWSINIHACHSPMREAQVLKDLLLDAFEKDPDLCPHDVIVMMPDIEAYAPYVEAVFSSEHKIPFAISDRRKKSESLSLEAFLKIIQLKDSRLEQARVLDLLRSPVISGRFDITGEDLFIMEEKLSNAKVLWGRDSDHRKELTGKGFIENTWKFGFQRLFMGYALPEGEETLVANVLPCDAFEGLDADILGKFAHFCHTLFAILRKLGSRKNIKEWGKCFKTLVQSMIEKKHTNESDMEFLIQTIDEFVRDGEAAGFAHEIDFSVAKEFIEIKLDKTFAQGSFLAGSLTFCNLMPMRSIPFKVVALMGMDESAFPRKTRADGFDLIKKHPQKGDKQERQEDRYLFLESLLSARNRLIITYTGMSIRDNSPIPCSGVVEELKDAIASSFEFPKGYTWSFTHPLHPFSPIYFKPSKPHQPDSNQPNLNPINSNQPGFFSFSQDQCKIAISQANIENKDKTDLFPGYFPDGFVLDQKKEDKTANLTLMNVTLDNLVWFFRNPVEAFVTKGLNLSFPQVEEQSPDREVFQVSGLSGYGLGSYYMENQSGQDLFPLVRAGGLLPFGQKGKSEWDRVAQLADPVMELANTMVPPNILPPFTVDTQVLGLRITGSIKDIYQDGRYVKGFGRLNPGRLLTQWIYHLFYQAAIQDLNFCGASAQDQVMDSCKNFSLKPTHLIGQDPKGKIPAVVYSFAPIPNAFDYITDLISLYQKGQHQVLAFFCETCFHLAESLGRNNYEITRENLAIALQQSRRFWFDRFRKTGESLNRNISLVFGQKDPFENLESLVKSGIVENALAIYQPLFENLTCKS